MADIYSLDPSRDRGKMGENLILTGENGKQGPEVEIFMRSREREIEAQKLQRSVESIRLKASLIFSPTESDSIKTPHRSVTTR
ncbi:hypothetical protein CDAR_289961 [Caerostris darwini]|uniref:Uncharacterized protein n=1 Tax=Caerostris darwini TaxID=1538125 RepID=A0AAV4WYM1_9ARAC|nr:hypothetical protein CDAR_289961 [Caerostris darwini]